MAGAGHSAWSARNVGHVARLIAEGRMRPAGLAQVERARADGRRDAALARARQIEKFVEMLAHGETVYPQRCRIDS